MEALALQPDDKLHKLRATNLAALRIVLVAHALGVLTQAIFAGQFLSGIESPVVFHEWTAWLIVSLSALQVVLAVVMARFGGPLWLVIASLFILIAEGLQTGTGYGRFLGVHVPLGAFVFGAVVWLATWAFRKQAVGGARSL
ncbi:MAG: hypothetical protein LAP38_10325 [Acidobacteriia bacterium]|nr:hypothetical protein [Terriglobia bacterium]